MARKFSICAVLLWLLLINSKQLFGQDHDVNFDDYQSLVSEGDFDPQFRNFIESNIDQEIDEPTNLEKGYVKKMKSDFHVASNLALKKLLLSGRITYGDPVTKYINKVADEVLKWNPKLRKQLNFYTHRSSSVNALCTAKGVILVNIGLIARLKTESELAFILCHEISHYTQKHAINGYVEKKEIIRGKGKYSRESFEDKIDLLYQYSKLHEFEADSIGMTFFLRSNYDGSGAVNMMDRLGYSHLPFDNISYNKRLLDYKHVVIPNSFYKEGVSPINKIEAYNDDYHTHPSVYERSLKLEKHLDEKAVKNNQEKHFLVSKNEFETIRQIARFDLVELELSRREYGNAIYNASVLLEKYPNNKYLEICIAKALYGLVKYKNADEFSRVAKSYTKVDGESQQVHYLLRKLTGKQLNIVAINYLKKGIDKYPEAKMLIEFKEDLLKELVIKNQVKLEEFYRKNKDEFVAKDFYKFAFLDEINDSDFISKFEAYYEVLKRKSEYDKLTYKEKQKLERKKEKSREKEGRKINAKKVLILDPDVFSELNKRKDFINEEGKKVNLYKTIKNEAINAGLNTVYINSSDFRIDNTEGYNRFSKFKLLIQEMYAHGELDMLPILMDSIKDPVLTVGVRFAYYIRVFGDKYFNSILYDLKSGKIVYANFTNDTKLTSMVIQKLINTDFKTIQR